MFSTRPPRRVFRSGGKSALRAPCATTLGTSAGCAQRNRQVCAELDRGLGRRIVEVGDDRGTGRWNGAGGVMGSFGAEQASGIAAKRGEVAEAVQAGDQK